MSKERGQPLRRTQPPQRVGGHAGGLRGFRTYGHTLKQLNLRLTLP
jgi:hypothetical protein